MQLLLHVGDVVLRPVCRWHLAFDRGIFRWQAEGVPAHRVQHILALEPLEPGYHIAQGIGAHMAKVELAAGVGEHGQAIVLGLVWALLHLKGAFLLPALLHRLLQLVGVVGWCAHLFGQ